MSESDSLDAVLTARQAAMQARLAAFEQRHPDDPWGYMEEMVREAIKESQWMMARGIPREAAGMMITERDTGAVICHTSDRDAMKQFRRYAARRRS